MGTEKEFCLLKLEASICPTVLHSNFGVFFHIFEETKTRLLCEAVNEREKNPYLQYIIGKKASSVFLSLILIILKVSN